MGGGALCQHIHCRSITGGLRSSASNLMNDALSQQRARFDESASLPWFQQAFSQRILDFYLVLLRVLLRREGPLMVLFGAGLTAVELLHISRLCSPTRRLCLIRVL